MLRSLGHRELSLVAATCAAAASVLTGIAVVEVPVVGLCIVVLSIASAVGAFWGMMGMAACATAVLPWLVVTSDILPRLTVTAASGLTALLVMVVSRPVLPRSRPMTVAAVGVVLWGVVVAASLVARGADSDSLIQAAKLLVFPVMVVALVCGTDRRALCVLRTVGLASGVLAVSVNFTAGMLGLNATYYQQGEILGLGGEHGVALLAAGVCVAALASAGSSYLWGVGAVVAGAASVATGVRSVLPGLVLAVLTALLWGRVRARTFVLVVSGAVVLMATGAVDVFMNRLARGQELGEFDSVSSFGSGRGAIYEAALAAWRDGGLPAWLMGTGLRTIPEIVRERLGTEFVGHSDVVEVGVQLGIVGLAALILLWGALLASSRSRLPLVVLASFALFNGSLEYGGALIVTMLLSVTSEVVPLRHPLPPGSRFSYGRSPRSHAAST